MSEYDRSFGAGARDGMAVLVDCGRAPFSSASSCPTHLANEDCPYLNGRRVALGAAWLLRDRRRCAAVLTGCQTLDEAAAAADDCASVRSMPLAFLRLMSASSAFTLSVTMTWFPGSANRASRVGAGGGEQGGDCQWLIANSCLAACMRRKPSFSRTSLGLPPKPVMCVSQVPLFSSTGTRSAASHSNDGVKAAKMSSMLTKLPQCSR